MKGLTAIVMAKRPRAGLVKTRLVRDGFLDDAEAAALARAMLRCTVERLAARAGRLVVAVSPDPEPNETAASLVGDDLPGRTLVVGQGDGDLGARLDRVWRRFGREGPVAFFGADSPDVPSAALAAIEPALAGAEVAAGPTGDGGYWTLAARAYAPAVLAGIDWGTGSVYDQTRRRAADAGLTIVGLPAWHDVDLPADVSALRDRIAGAGLGDAGTTREEDDAVARLAACLESLLKARR